jgi:guanosine-3',5'-bis(diphosphate) 3'-pyrophosphohydrolase
MNKFKYYFPLVNFLLFTNPLQASFMEHSEPQWFFHSSEGIEQSIQECRAVVKEYALNDPSVLHIFDKTVAAWSSYFNQTQGKFDIQLLLKALAFAAVKHQGQTRDNAHATPYIIHPIGVAYLVWEIGNIRDEKVLATALLHDTLEDTSTTAEELESLFGTHICETVKELTNDPTLTSQENKQRQINHASHLSIDAKVVKLADRLYNVQDLRLMPPNWAPYKIKIYLGWGQKLLDALRGTNPQLEWTLQEEILLQS